MKIKTKRKLKSIAHIEKGILTLGNAHRNIEIKIDLNILQKIIKKQLGKIR